MSVDPQAQTRPGSDRGAGAAGLLRHPRSERRELWRFLIVTAEADRVWYRDMLADALADRLKSGPPDENDTSTEARVMRMYRRFVLEFDRIPAFIITAIENAFPRPERPDPHFMWSSVYSATQNLLLAARAMGLGAAMTTNHLENEPAVRAHFGIPDRFGIGATIPIGYPEGRYGPVRRRPVSEVISWNRWDNLSI
jgi:nitroreductase